MRAAVQHTSSVTRHGPIHLAVNFRLSDGLCNAILEMDSNTWASDFEFLFEVRVYRVGIRCFRFWIFLC